MFNNSAAEARGIQVAVSKMSEKQLMSSYITPEGRAISLTQSLYVETNVMHQSFVKASEACGYCRNETFHTHVFKVLGKGQVLETIVLGNYNETIETDKEQKCLSCNSSCKFICSGCRGMYCSRLCQMRHWSEHKTKCSGQMSNETGDILSTVPNDCEIFSLSGILNRSLQKPATTCDDNVEATPRAKKIQNIKEAVLNASARRDSSLIQKLQIANVKTARNASRKSNDKIIKADISILPNNNDTLSDAASTKIQKQALINMRIPGDNLTALQISKETLNSKIATEVILGFTAGPNDIWLQKLENSSEMIKLFNKIQEDAKELPLMSKPCTGDFCIAKFDMDNNFYRAQITSTENNVYTVHYIDYGNDAQVTLRDLRHLPPHLMKLPSQAISCSLSGIKSSPKNNSPNVIELITSFLSPSAIASVISECANGKLLVELKTIAGHLISDHLIRLGVEPLQTSKLSSTLQNSQSSPKSVQNVKTLSQSIHNSQSSAKQLPCKFMLNYSQLKNQNIPVNGRGPLVRSIIGRLPVNQKVQFMITVLNDPFEKLFLSSLIPSELASIVNIENDLNRLSSEYDPFFKPCKDEFVAALSPTFSSWYRAFILEVNADGYEVFFIDYGNEEHVTKVFKLKQEHLECDSVLIQAHVQLPLSTDHKNFLESLLPNFTIAAFVRSVKDDQAELELMQIKESALVLTARPWYHGVLKTQNQHTVSNSPKQNALETSRGSSISERFKPSLMAKRLTRIMANNIKHRDIGRAFVGYVVMGSDAPGICFQLKDEQEELNAMMNSLNNYFALDDFKPYNAVQGEMVCLRSVADTKWYRGRINSIVSYKMANVFLVDYGYIEEVHIDNIRPLPELFKNNPFYCICAELEGVSNRYLTPTVFEFLQKQPWKVNVISKTNPIKVKLFSEDGLFCVNDKILQGKCPVTSEMALTELSSNLNAKLSIHIPDLDKRYFFNAIPCHRLQVGQVEKVVVCSIINPLEILCLPKSAEDTQIQLKSELNNYFSDDNSIYTPKEEEICLVRSKAHNEWSRAVVLGVQESEITCLLIDTGIIVAVKNCDLKRLTPKLATFPRQVIHCALHGVSKRTEWSENVILKLESLLPPHSVQEVKVVSEDTTVDFVISLPKLSDRLGL